MLLSLFEESELERSPEPAIDKIMKEMHSNLTELSNETTSFRIDSFAQNLKKTARRHRRGVENWKYGSWCGAKQGGYKSEPNPNCKNICKKTTSYISSACRNCLPPKDLLDAACMEHDR